VLAQVRRRRTAMVQDRQHMKLLSVISYIGSATRPIGRVRNAINSVVA